MNRSNALKPLLSAALILVSAPGFGASAERGALTEAERRIANCLDHAASRAYPALSVGVIDATGTLVAFRRQDGAAPVTVDAALLKARTALRLNAPTAVLGPAVAGDAPTRDAFLILQLTSLPGGAPLADGKGLAVGAVGVSGASPDQDAECARRASESPATQTR